MLVAIIAVHSCCAPRPDTLTPLIRCLQLQASAPTASRQGSGGATTLSVPYEPFQCLSSMGSATVLFVILCPWQRSCWLRRLLGLHKTSLCLYLWAVTVHCRPGKLQIGQDMACAPADIAAASGGHAATAAAAAAAAAALSRAQRQVLCAAERRDQSVLTSGDFNGVALLMDSSSPIDTMVKSACCR